eukprot:TRINITY_DN45571_c0_g1_i1.p1 TRINITY_DN45571_c0_g1~~TRINITY_DN45571_c0_g1_i1.p1  ORF type:complete len:101 (+),score=10.48 TRINITY_DN45571_c0_g1_i1:41-304(+)
MGPRGQLSKGSSKCWGESAVALSALRASLRSTWRTSTTKAGYCATWSQVLEIASEARTAIHPLRTAAAYQLRIAQNRLQQKARNHAE